MTGFPVWFDANITQGELAAMLQDAGYVLKARNGLMSVVKKLPESLRSEEPAYEPS